MFAQGSDADCVAGSMGNPSEASSALTRPAARRWSRKAALHLVPSTQTPVTDGPGLNSAERSVASGTGPAGAATATLPAGSVARYFPPGRCPPGTWSKVNVTVLLSAPSDIDQFDGSTSRPVVRLVSFRSSVETLPETSPVKAKVTDWGGPL